MVLALCAAGIVLGLDLNLGARVAGAPTPAAVNRVALIGDDGNLYLVDRNGGSKVAVTTDAALSQSAGVQRAYVFPNWAPDSRQLAFVGISSENNGKAALYTVRTDDAKRVEIFSTGDALPFYLYWSPDSKRVAFLVQSQSNDLTLNIASADGSGSSEAGKGSPFYFSWAPDSQSVVSHVGGSRRQSADAFIGVHSVAGQSGPQNLALAPANFLAPAWSPDGKEFLSAETLTASGNDELTVTDGRGEHPRAIARYSGSIYFNWSPDGHNIAYLLGSSSSAKSELHVARADGSDNQNLTDDAPLAFFWSPDGTKIAYLIAASNGQSSLQFTSTDAQQTQQRLSWKIISVADRRISTLVSFLPTDTFAGIVSYFDQYAQSVRLWSPDSTALVYSLVEKDGTEGVYVINVDGSAEPKRIASGASAAWSWR
jgi:Tol biopolymer transport system component